MDNQSQSSNIPRNPPPADQSFFSQSDGSSFILSTLSTGQCSSGSSSADGPCFTPVFMCNSTLFDKEGGWDLEFVPSHSEKHGCPICLLALREPMQTECGHRFCQSCILKWLRESEARCPVDNQPLEEKQLFPDNFAKREILALNVKCPNHTAGCDQIVILNYLQNHLKECTYEPIICPNGCSTMMLRGKLTDHCLNSCPKRKVKCSMCQSDIIADKQQEHLSECPLASVTCPNCGKSLVRSQLSSHISSECEKSLTKCQYHFIGCNYEGERGDMPSHEQSEMLVHMSLINQTVIRLCHLLRQNPAGAVARHPSSLGIQPAEGPVVGSGSGAASFPSYFRNPGNSQITMLQDILRQINLSADSLSVSPVQSYVTSYASPAPVTGALLTAAPPVNNIGGGEPQVNSGEQRASTNATQTNVLSFISKPSETLDQEMPMSCSNDPQLLSIKSQNDLQDESLARHDSQLIDLRHACDYHEKVIREMKSKIKTLETSIQDFEGRNGNGVFVWKIKNYLKLRCDAEKGETTAIHSGPFYSSFHGYKLCIRVNLNGVDTARGTHLSLFIHFMQGEFDDLLEWPFNGKIILTVIDQNPICEMRRDISETLLSKPNLAAFQRPSSSRNHKGFGYMEFLPLNVINGSTYVRNDTLIIKASVIPTNT